MVGRGQRGHGEDEGLSLECAGTAEGLAIYPATVQTHHRSSGVAPSNSRETRLLQHDGPRVWRRNPHGPTAYTHFPCHWRLSPARITQRYTGHIVARYRGCIHSVETRRLEPDCYLHLGTETMAWTTTGECWGHTSHYSRACTPHTSSGG